MTWLIDMAAVSLLFQHDRYVNMQNLPIERPLADPDNVFQLDDKMLVSQYRLPRAKILQLAERCFSLSLESGEKKCLLRGSRH